jgi:very-short-patch-repair endonuclease
MDKFKCKECNREFESLDSLRRHRSQAHKIGSEQTYIDYVLDGIEPKCKCGCGQKPNFLSIQNGFRDYVLGHSSRVNNNWGHNSEAVKKSHETQKKMYEKGELIPWNKGLDITDDRVKKNIEKTMSNPNRGKNISKKLSGVPKSKKHKEKISKNAKKRWSNPEERKKQSDRLIKRLTEKNNNNKKTQLEKQFQSFLESLGLKEKIDFKYQYQVAQNIFDFYLFKYNILIEVDGDFHHCNPNSEHRIPQYPIQLKTVANDIKKDRLAEDKNYKLLRFWETDIKTNKEEVIKILKKELNL